MSELKFDFTKHGQMIAAGGAMKALHDAGYTGADAASKLPKQEPPKCRHPDRCHSECSHCGGRNGQHSAGCQHSICHHSITAPLPASESPTGKFFGTWPGEESDAELQTSLAQIDSPASEGAGADKGVFYTIERTVGTDRPLYMKDHQAHAWTHDIHRAWEFDFKSAEIVWRGQIDHFRDTSAIVEHKWIDFPAPTPPATGEAAHVPENIEECTARGEQIKHADRPELESGVPLTHCPCWWDGDICCNCGHAGDIPSSLPPSPKPGEPVGDVELPPLDAENQDWRWNDHMRAVIRERQLREALTTIHSERALRIEAENSLKNEKFQHETYQKAATEAAFALGIAPDPERNSEWHNIRAEAAEAKLSAVAAVIEKDVIPRLQTVKAGDWGVPTREAIRILQSAVAAAEKEDANGK